MGIGARSLWKAGLLRQDTWKERRLGQAIPDAEHCLVGTAWSRDLKSKSIKWAKSAFQTPGAFLAFKVTLGRQEGAPCRAVSAAMAWWVAA